MSDYNFNPQLACEIGLEEAIVIHNISFWIKHNKANDTHFYDGRHWTYNTVKAFQQLFPFWTLKQMRTIMESLYKKEVILKGNYNKKEFDKTGWYAFTDKYAYLANLPIAQTGKAYALEGKGDAQEGKPIPYIKQDSKQSLSLDKDNVLPFSEKEIQKKRRKFIKPTVEELSLVIKDKKTAQKFLNHYEGNGWMIGKTKMVDWIATAHNWIIDTENTTTGIVINF